MVSPLSSLAPAPDPASLRREPGQLVAGRYRIEQQLAEGGMGVVFRARDERNGMEVALKQLRVLPGLNQSALAAVGVQFEREYHTLSQLSHPCIIQVFDYGVDEGGAYYTMELLRGQDLRQRGRLHWREACAVLRDVASSLAILHSRRLLHRDVSTRNVFCIEGGRSKLIDFGAMMPMGVAKHLVGTPPFVPLEALQQQSLDGRSDLYSLGALAYWVLTGTYAYSARSLGELKERFATPPPGLRQHDAEIPEALDTLVMALLQLDRAARPGSAAEVMERLSGIAGLALHEHVEVSRAYLSTPTLVGRDPGLERVAVELSAGRQGTGGSTLIEGAAGSGRSRMLDACVMRAKLRGAVVLRSDAADGANGAYGIARALGMQLIEALPTEALAAARPARDVLGHVLPGLSQRSGPTSIRPAVTPARHQLQAALRDFFLAVARDKHIVIAVDDVERGDEPSTAMLGAMALDARRRRLNMLLTIGTDAPHTAALALLRQESRALPIGPLSAAQTERLLCSVFGEVPHVSGLAERIHAIAGGSPSATMMLAEHLVTERIARYEAGTWALPAQLLPEHLPSSTGAALLSRVQALPPDARDLAELLALTEPETIAPEVYSRLAEHGDPGRTYRALEALTTSGVLQLIGDRYRFAQFDAAPTIQRQLDPERTRALHARLAQALEAAGNADAAVEHLLLGGQERIAVERILARFTTSNVYGGYTTPQTLQRALEAAERLELPLRTRLELRSVMLQNAATTGQPAFFVGHADVVAKRLEFDAGLLDYAKLPVDMDPAARLAEALRRTAQRYAATPPDERGFALPEIPSALMRVYGACTSMSAIAQDLEMLERLPRLDPLIGLAPIMGWLNDLFELQIAHRAGRNTRALALATSLAERLAHVEDSPGSPAVLARILRQGMLYMLGLFAATGGQAHARDCVSELEQIPGQRGNAWRVRMVYELMHGNVDAATECQRRSELLNLQDGGQLQLPGTTARVELLAYMYSDDLLGVKRATERIAELAQVFPFWGPTLAVARCHYRRLQGDPEGGLADLQPALHVRVGRHCDWWLIAYTHVRVLSDLDRADEAVRCGESYIETWAREEISPVDYGLRQVTADALLKAGRALDAQNMIDMYIDSHVRAGTRGLRLGLAYETRARIAIALRDEQAVQHYTRLCAQQYKGGRHLALLNRYARLLRDADAGGIALTTGLRMGAESQNAATHTVHTVHTVQSRLQSTIGALARAQTALGVLLEASGAELGFLYGVREGALVKLAPGEADAPAGLQQWLDTYLRRELEDVSTAVGTGEQDADDDGRFRDEAGREYEPLLLSGKPAGQEVIAGIVALHYTSTRRPTLRRGVIQALTDVLIGDRIIEPLTL